MKDLSNENIIHVKNKDIQYLQFRRLLNYKDKITHAYSLGIERSYRTVPKEGETFEEKRKVTQQNYKDLCNAIGADYDQVVYSNQVHTDTVEVIKDIRNFEDENLQVDGLCTNIKEIALSTINADCILFMFYDPVKNVVANIHSGWKGTLKRISVKTIEKMKQEYGCNPEDIICCIGPHIRKCHFEVDEDVKDLFYNKFKELKGIEEIIEYNKENNKYYIDTARINKQTLLNIGLKEENIIDSNICTVCNSDICHSFRTEKELSGRAVTIIYLK